MKLKKLIFFSQKKKTKTTYIPWVHIVQWVQIKIDLILYIYTIYNTDIQNIVTGIMHIGWCCVIENAVILKLQRELIYKFRAAREIMLQTLNSCWNVNLSSPSTALATHTTVHDRRQNSRIWTPHFGSPSQRVYAFDLLRSSTDKGHNMNQKSYFPYNFFLRNQFP